MPIDASIYNNVQPQPSPIQTLASLSALKGQQQQQQLTGLELQEKQRQINGEKLLDNAYAKYVGPDGVDYNGLANEVARGGYGHLAPAIIKSGVEVRKSMADAVEAQGKAEDAQRNAAGNIGAGMQDILDKGGTAEDAAGYGVTHIAALRKVGLIPPDEASAIAQAMDPSNPDALKRTISSMIAASPKRTELSSAATTANARAVTAQTGAVKAAAELPGIQAKAAVDQQVAAGTQGGVTPYQQAELANQAKQRAISAGQLAVAQQREKREAGQAAAAATAGAPAGIGIPDVQAGQKNDQFLQTLPPATASQVKALVEGRLQVPSGAALRSPYWQGLIQSAYKYDPTFDTVNYNARAKTRSDFTTGKAASQVNAINTVIGHLDNLSNAADNLHNTNYPMLNAAENFASQAVGRSNVTNFNVTRKAVADELTRVWRQAGGSEQDIQENLKNLNAANSPEQLHGAIATFGHLLQSKLSSLNEQYRQGMGTDKIDMITPESQKTLQRLEQRAGKAPAAGGGDVPAPVEQALKGQSVGRHTLSDGSVWDVMPGGSVRKVK